jgi:hypothetical protein
MEPVVEEHNRWSLALARKSHEPIGS